MPSWPEAPGPHLPRRVAVDAAPRHGCVAQRVVRHGLPEAGPPGGRAGHPGCARRLRGRRRAQLRRRLLRGRARAGLEPGPGGPAGPGRDGPGQRRRGPRRLPRRGPCGYPPVRRRMGPGARRARRRELARRRASWAGSKRNVAGSPPRTLDAPCIASCWNGGSEKSTPGWCGRGRSWPCSNEQLAVVDESADEARVRALVSETPLATQEHNEARVTPRPCCRRAMRSRRSRGRPRTPPGRAPGRRRTGKH